MKQVPKWLVAAILAGTCQFAVADGLKYVETADGSKSSQTRDLIQWTHTRLVFDKPLERVAVGQQATLELEVLGSHEVLALAKAVGRTSIMVWYTDETSDTFLFSVVQDLTVLRRALRDVHPGIRLELAPDRAALVLRGTVPTIKFRQAAESVARNYLEVGNRRAPDGGDILVRAGASAADSDLRVSPSSAASERSTAIINLIQVEELPQSLEEKIRSAIDLIGGENVIVGRIQAGDIPDDGLDTLTLSGEVENQVVLTRILNVAGRLLLGKDGADSGGIQVVADESGALLAGRTGGLGGSGSGFSGLGSGGSLDNEIRANIGRSRLLAAGGGRILSMIEVRDLPLVRVSVQMHEVDRVRLKTWRPDLSLISTGYNSGGRFPIEGLQQRSATASEVENALQMVGGALINNLQIASGSYAFDLLFSLLEEEGISRTLSRPTLTVLAGESAVFRAGGEVPVPSAFAPTGIADGDTVGANAAGVFSGTEFKAFGVELRVRAMVDEQDRITLDVSPTVSLPDTALTQQIASSTGSDLNTAAFDVRSIQTSTRVRDGQPLVLGGLVTRDVTSNDSATPGLSDVPLLGRLAESFSKGDSDTELVIVVTPTIVREPKHETDLWQYPDTRQLLDWAVSVVGPGVRSDGALVRAGRRQR